MPQKSNPDTAAQRPGSLPEDQDDELEMADDDEEFADEDDDELEDDDLEDDADVEEE
jgi:hypothetical protein